MIFTGILKKVGEQNHGITSWIYKKDTETSSTRLKNSKRKSKKL